MDLNNTSLILFSTGNTHLKNWVKLGILNREIIVYKKLSKYLKGVSLVTYGGNQDKRYLNLIEPVKLLTTKWGHGQLSTAVSLLWKHFLELNKADVLKTNQVAGAEIGILIKLLLGKKLIVRAGYLPSRFIKKQTKNQKAIAYARHLEKKAFKAADLGIVTTPKDRQYLIRKYHLAPEKIKVIPNYVITTLFRPKRKDRKKYDLVYIGRSSKQKNLNNLLQALLLLKKQGKSVSLLLIGNCSQDKNLREFVQANDLKVTFQGTLPHRQLPLFINQSRIFILPSLWEGHPKALLEAMSCGTPCIGTNVIGIKKEIIHLETGYLTKTDPQSLAQTIKKVLSNPQLRKKIGQNARQYILKNYSLDKIVKLELDAIKSLS